MTFVEQEPVEEMANLLDEYEKKTGVSVPIHVDGYVNFLPSTVSFNEFDIHFFYSTSASGGFVAPFATPSLKWDFRYYLFSSFFFSNLTYSLVRFSEFLESFRSTRVVTSL